MKVSALLVLAAWIVGVASAQSAASARAPHVGYLYPAGGRQGTTFYILAGGQRIRNASAVYVSGDGVHATIIRYLPPFRLLSREQIKEARTRLEEVRKNPPPTSRPTHPAPTSSGKDTTTKDARKDAPPTSNPTTRPDDPNSLDISTLTVNELEYLAAMARSGDKKQPNAQIADVLLLEVAIDPNAALGDRELRLGSPAGLTNPLRFQVGRLPEVMAQEPIGPAASDAPTLEPPFLLNGQIMPGDVDRFRFHAQSGQKLVVDVQARRLIPYLADAVPGWFQATLALSDAEGHELAFVDDYRFSPDPILLYEVPADGEYELAIRDALYRGREDFVYRISLGESPFVTQLFPLGGRAGNAKMASIAGWNLPSDRLRLDMTSGPDGIRQTMVRRGPARSNEVSYAVDSLPESLETEPNDDDEHAEVIKVPRIINGHIGQPGDADVFKFSGRKSDEVVAEVCARRLGSPLDSQLALLDASGQVLEANDDCEATATGLLTHHADSYLRLKLPEAGDYYIRLTDAQQHGGEEYGYRLRIGRPQPDFELRLTPSSITVPAGRAAPVRVHVLRKDGFDGEIELTLKNAPAGFALGGGRIPPGRDSIRLTIVAPHERPKEPTVLQLEGRGRGGTRTITRPVVPAEDMMQAFAYRHLVPSQALLVAVTNAPPRAPDLTLPNATPVRIPAGGTAEVRVPLPPRTQTWNLKAELNEPPQGVTLQNVTEVSGSLVLLLKASATALEPESADNLIVEVFVESKRPPQDDKAAKPPQRQSIGFLPAIPIEIVRQ